MNELEGIASLMAKAHESGYQQGAAAGRAEVERLRAAAEAAQRVSDEYEEDVPMRSMPPLRKALAALRIVVHDH